MSAFNPDTFLTMETADALPSKYTPVPRAEYRAFVDDVEPRTVKTKNGDSPMLTVTFDIRDADDVKASIGLKPEQKLTVRQDYWLDLNEQGGFDIGPNKNVKLGILREALNQNKPGQPWSPAMMKGQGPVLLQVDIEPDAKDPMVERNVIKRLAKAL